MRHVVTRYIASPHLVSDARSAVADLIDATIPVLAQSHKNPAAVSEHRCRVLAVHPCFARFDEVLLRFVPAQGH